MGLTALTKRCKAINVKTFFKNVAHLEWRFPAEYLEVEPVQLPVHESVLGEVGPQIDDVGHPNGHKLLDKVHALVKLFRRGWQEGHRAAGRRGRVGAMPLGGPGGGAATHPQSREAWEGLSRKRNGTVNGLF